MLTLDCLEIDLAAETARIAHAIREQVLGTLRKRGAVVGLSGGIDSSTVAALCVHALGKDRVFGVFMPERDSSAESLELGRALSASLGIESVLEDLTSTLDAAGCYRRQDEAIASVVPGYGPGWKCKIVLPSILDADRLNVSRLTVEDPAGVTTTHRLNTQAYLQLVAATNYKQRMRTLTEYYHADRLNYAVAGTPNRLEYDQGFFVKQGDGAADFKPIAHLYKTQVYKLAAYLGVPQAICSRAPTTDTFSLAQSQEEFYFALPYSQMDVCLYAFNQQIAAAETGRALGLSGDQVERVYRDIASKRRGTRYLHTPPLLVETVAEIGA